MIGMPIIEISSPLLDPPSKLPWMVALYPRSWNLDQSITPPNLGESLIFGKTSDISTSGGIYPLPAAAGAAGNPRKIWPASTLLHVFQDLMRLLALPLAY